MVIHLENNQDLESILSIRKWSVVKFSTATCQPCLMLAPLFVEASNLEDFSEVAFVSVNAKEYPLGKKYQITSVPTLMYFKETELVFTEIGFQPLPVLMQKIRELMNQ